MKRITATAASRQFSELLDLVEREGETVVIERRGRLVAAISPAPVASGRAVNALLVDHQPDDRWPADLETIRTMIAPEVRRWAE